MKPISGGNSIRLSVVFVMMIWGLGGCATSTLPEGGRSGDLAAEAPPRAAIRTAQAPPAAEGEHHPMAPHKAGDFGHAE